jgi:hypothetical protein
MILNLTQHPATTEQINQGVVDLSGERLSQLKDWLTFENLPTRQEIEDAAHSIALLAVFNDLGGEDGDSPHPLYAMIGGAPFLMSALESALLDHGIKPVYAFSRREGVEETQADGSVRKTNVFRHVGFVGLE